MLFKDLCDQASLATSVASPHREVAGFLKESVTALGLHCCAQAFSGCGELGEGRSCLGLLLGLLDALTSLAAAGGL